MTFSQTPPVILVLGAGKLNPNFGVQMLASGSESFIRGLIPNVKIVFHDDSLINLKKGKSGFVSRKIAFIKNVNKANMVMNINGGDSFTSIYGYKRLFKIYLYGYFIKLAKKNYIYLPQTIGPFRSSLSRKLAREILKQPEVVMVRGESKNLEKFQISSPIVCPDISFAALNKIGLRRQVNYDIALNVSGLLWCQNTQVDSNSYQQFIYQLIDELLKMGLSIYIIPHVLGEGDTDILPMQDLKERFAGKVSFSKATSLEEVWSLIQCARLSIGARYHFCLNSIQQGIPTIHHSYSPKFKSLELYSEMRLGVDLVSSPNWLEQTLLQVGDLMKSETGEFKSEAKLRESVSRIELARSALREKIEFRF